MGSDKKVLVIDDTLGIRKFLKITLENYNYSVIESDEGLDGFEKFETEKPDIVILDLGLPDIDGLDVLRKIREINKETPVIILTVRSEESSVKSAYEIGANAYITKPFQIDQVIDILEEMSPN